MGQIFRTFSLGMIIAAAMVCSFLGGIWIVDPDFFWLLVDEIIMFFDRPAEYVSNGVASWRILRAAEKW